MRARTGVRVESEDEVRGRVRSSGPARMTEDKTKRKTPSPRNNARETTVRTVWGLSHGLSAVGSEKGVSIYDSGSIGSIESVESSP